jgi:hypothetical protein
MHEPCQCDSPTPSCPHYGWMKGHKWEHCQGVGVSAEKRQQLLDVYQRMHERPQQPVAPSPLQKAVNFAKAVVKHAADGAARVDDETLAKRLAVCKEPCGMLLEDLSCGACGCPVEVKATWQSEICPLRKWPGEARPGTGGCGSCKKSAA